MCKFCEAMEKARDNLPLLIPHNKLGFRVYLVSFITAVYDNHEENYTITDDRLGDGHVLNFCPECGRKLREVRE